MPVLFFIFFEPDTVDPLLLETYVISGDMPIVTRKFCPVLKDMIVGLKDSVIFVDFFSP